MLDNVFFTEELRSLATRKRSKVEHRSVLHAQVDDFVGEGWEIVRTNKRTVRLSRPKPFDMLLEDRVWALLYKMGFEYMSGLGGAHLGTGTSVKLDNQLDVVAVDDEVALAVECKSAAAVRKYTAFQEDLAKFNGNRKKFADAIHDRAPLAYRRIPVMCLFTSNLLCSESDLERARQDNVLVFDDKDLDYYERLVEHLGPAAKYQFLADVLPGRQVRGLELCVPALKAKMGANTFYLFAIHPEYLLKIAYVSHRAKGKPTDVDTYQRMIKKSRLKKIRTFIDDGGVFPTNIVVNFEDKKYLRFDQGKNPHGSDGARFGFLHLEPAYRAAWIIDGQHRVFAYSGSERSKTSYVNVLAYEGLPAPEQAQMFVDINHEQKSVKQSLLQELYAELHWNSDDERVRLRAILSKAIQALGEQKDSPLHGRILLSDDKRTATRCISLSSMFGALNQSGLFIISPGLEYGPLWAATNEKTLKRTITVLKGWFDFIASGAPQWWDLGSGEGGGLAMNDAVVMCIGVLRSALQHVGKTVPTLTLSDSELVEALSPLGAALGSYLGSLDEAERASIRSLRGGQGQSYGRRKMEKALHDVFPEFEPPGLKEALELEAAKTNEQAFAIINRLEATLHSFIVETVKSEFGESAWWFSAIPQRVRKKTDDRYDDDQGKRGEKDLYFDLLDYREIVMNNWDLFKTYLSRGSGGKAKQTDWLVKLNEIRKCVMHPSAGVIIGFDDLSLLEGYDTWLDEMIPDTGSSPS